MTEQPKNRFTQKSLRLSGFDRHFDVLALVSTAAKAQVDALALRADRAGLRVRSQCRLCVSKNGSTNFHSEATARSHSRILHPPRLWMGGLTENPMGLFGHRPPLVCRVSSATLHVCGVRVRHCNHHKGVSRNARSSGRYKNILCAPRVSQCLFSIKQSTSLQSQTSIYQTIFQLQAFQLPSNLLKPKQPKYNGHRNVPTILLPLHQLLRCFHLLEEILHLQHPSSLHTRLPGLHRPPLP
jgi:hypothetical protein